MNMEFRRMDDERITQLDKDLSTLTERVANWMDTTIDYRKQLCSKLDDHKNDMKIIRDKIDNLPCPARVEHTKNIDFQLKAIWAVTGGLVLAIIAEWVKGHGNM